jgi:F-type H+-transporting ATPase subunit alpha
MPVDRQVIVLFAGSQGHLDDVPVEAVRRFEKEFLAFIDARYADVPTTIEKERDLSPATQEKLTSAVKEFKAQFKA